MRIKKSLLTIKSNINRKINFDLLYFDITSSLGNQCFYIYTEHMFIYVTELMIFCGKLD